MKSASDVSDPVRVTTIPLPARPRVSVRDALSASFMSVKQVAEYLQINERKVYALASEGRLPGTKVTGKWLFPRELVDQWLLESSHGGVLTDRLVLTGSDDPLLYRVITNLANEIQAKALVNYTCTGTTLGLSLLARRRADACAIHWGPVEESHQRHPALLRNHPEHPYWLLVRLFHRAQGLMLARNAPAPAVTDLGALISQPLRWAMRQPGAGSQRFLQEIAARYDIDLDQLDVVGYAYTEREAAAMVAMGQADVAPGTQGAANEFGLAFVAVGWEAFDLALSRSIYFRTLFQKLLDQLRSPYARTLANTLGGYDLRELGAIVWSG